MISYSIQLQRIDRRLNSSYIKEVILHKSLVLCQGNANELITRSNA